MEFKVFYSWQSDLPNPCNRGFIQTALEAAAKTLRADDSIKVEPVIDRDTAGVAGSPDIGRTILKKIDEAQAFVADVSIIGKFAGRPSPNPNVLFELGYAWKTLAESRVIMVMNTAFGALEQLPFDLRMKKIIHYNSPSDAQERGIERKMLASKFEDAIRAVISEPVIVPGTDKKSYAQLKSLRRILEILLNSLDGEYASLKRFETAIGKQAIHANDGERHTFSIAGLPDPISDFDDVNALLDDAKMWINEWNNLFVEFTPALIVFNQKIRMCVYIGCCVAKALEQIDLLEGKPPREPSFGGAFYQRAKHRPWE